MIGNAAAEIWFTLLVYSGGTKRERESHRKMLERFFEERLLDARSQCTVRCREYPPEKSVSEKQAVIAFKALCRKKDLRNTELWISTLRAFFDQEERALKDTS